MSIFDERGVGSAGTLSPRQARIVAQLARLLGQGTADFFHDACAMVVETPAHRAASHLVSHALREADSGLRKVLEPRKAEPKRSGKSNDGHLRSITAVCEVLGLPMDHPAVEFWLDQAGESPTNLAARAHRRGLERPRPLDRDFREFFGRVEDLFEVLLERFEAQYTIVFDRLDVLLASEPSTALARELWQHLPANER